LFQAACKIGRLGKARLSSWHVAPLLDNWLLDLSWVGARPGANLLGDVYTLLGRLEQRHQLGDMLALLLGLQVAGLLWDFRNNSFSPGEALLWTRLQLTAGWAAELLGDLLTLSLWRVLLDIGLLLGTDLLGPLGTLLFSCVALSDILTLFLLDGFTVDNVVLNIMLMVPGLTLGLIDGPTFDWALTIADEWSVAELNLFLRCYLPVVNEAVLDEVFLALLLLLRLKISGVGGVALLGVAVLALNDIIVLSLLNHHHFVNTPFTSSGNGSNVQGDIVTTSLTRCTSIKGIVSMGMLMLVVVIMSSVGGSLSVTLVEWECSPQVLASPVGTSS